jgi:hypothetical protein
MRPFGIRKKLGQTYRSNFFALSFLCVLLLLLFVPNLANHPRVPVLAICFLTLPVGGVVYYSLKLFHLDRHPDLVALGRYGPLSALVPAIDAELADTRNVVRLGHVLVSFTLTMGRTDELGNGEVLLTPS